MTVANCPRDLWIDPTDGYTVRVRESLRGVGPSPEDRFYGHSPEAVIWGLWCVIPGQDDPYGPTTVIGLHSEIHDRIPPSLLEFGFSSETHFMLGSFALRIGARPAVEALLAEIRTERHRRDPEELILGLREIRALHTALDETALEALRDRYLVAAEYDQLDWMAEGRFDIDDWPERSSTVDERLSILEAAEYEQRELREQQDEARVLYHLTLESGDCTPIPRSHLQESIWERLIPVVGEALRTAERVPVDDDPALGLIIRRVWRHDRL